MATRLACPSCGIAVPVDGPLPPQRQVTCPECRTVFSPSQGMIPGQRPASGGGSGTAVVVILCVVLGLGLVVALGAVAAVGAVFYLAAESKPAIPADQPVAGMPPGGMPPGFDQPPPGGQPPRAAGPKIGEVAPEITGEDTDGKPMKLSDYKGKVVVLDFWGHW